ncbi:hypothetical protein BpHYR1_040046 [Brachionus plicatilis]|uniref:Uncharacterized protein n=1 Tax=Brachionus plicatilis TaxID=10195 RepID=A0A3M7QKG1_BRAPC|nr:hypothetical protein BpHYR1_040046 [Brachionus plicatilis]
MQNHQNKKSDPLYKTRRILKIKGILSNSSEKQYPKKRNASMNKSVVEYIRFKRYSYRRLRKAPLLTEIHKIGPSPGLKILNY